VGSVTDGLEIHVASISGLKWLGWVSVPAYTGFHQTDPQEAKFRAGAWPGQTVKSYQTTIFMATECIKNHYTLVFPSGQPPKNLPSTMLLNLPCWGLSYVDSCEGITLG
jgi:hypothetical protein